MAADSPSAFRFRPDKLPISNSRYAPIGHSWRKSRSNMSIDENNVTFAASGLAVLVGPWLPSTGPRWRAPRVERRVPATARRTSNRGRERGTHMFLGARFARLGVKPHDGGRANSVRTRQLTS